MAVRKVVTRSSCHFRGYFPSLKNGHSVGWESQLEGGFFRLLELSPCVRSYEAQPTWEKFNVDGSLVKYAPDIRAFLMDGSEWWFEVKPKTELLIRRVKQKLDAAKIHFSASGRSFSVVTDALIWSEPSARNLQRILYHRRGPLLSPTLHAEVPKHTDKGRSNSITGELKDVLDDVIAKYYLLDTRPTVSSVVGAYHHEIDLINSGRLTSRQLIKPCGMTVRRYIAKLDPYEVDVHRLGKFAAKKKHRAAVEILTVDGILDRWEIDHTLLDVLLVDDETGLP